MSRRDRSLLRGVMVGMLPLYLPVGIWLLVYLPLDAVDPMGVSLLKDFVFYSSVAALPVGVAFSVVRCRAAKVAGNAIYSSGVWIGFCVSGLLYGLIFWLLFMWVSRDPFG